MDANEKSKRLMLVTDIKFRLDKDGNIVESDRQIAQAVIDQAMNMPKAEYEQRIESQRRDGIVAQLRNDYGMQAAYIAYQSASGSGTFDEFARIAVDAVEDAKRI